MYTGLKDGCLEASLTATALFRRLAREHPEAYELDLAQSLANLGMMYGYAGDAGSHDAEEGLRVSCEAVDLFRRLVPRAPLAVEPLLAGSLHSMGKRLLQMGRAEDAQKILAEAIDTLRPFYREYPEAWRDRMEMLLASYGNTARALGLPIEPP
jgi:tetratricopeptide (TPR) repeat protein